MSQLDKEGTPDHLDFSTWREGRPSSATRPVRRAASATIPGCDLLPAREPYKIPHEKVMRSIELLGERVIQFLQAQWRGEHGTSCDILRSRSALLGDHSPARRPRRRWRGWSRCPGHDRADVACGAGRREQAAAVRWSASI
jgi:hypothetical protein